jgi:hypothetical protein
MGILYKILGQTLTTANTTSNLYSVPAATNTVISTVSICNQSNTSTSFRVAVRPTSEALAAKHYLNFDTPLPGNDTITLTLGITMGALDVLVVNAATSTVSCSAFGSEIS